MPSMSGSNAMSLSVYSNSLSLVLTVVARASLPSSIMSLMMCIIASNVQPGAVPSDLYLLEVGLAFTVVFGLGDVLGVLLRFL